MKHLIDFYQAAPIGCGAQVPYSQICEEAFKCGYMVHPKIANETLLDYMKFKNTNPNSTFYRKWEDIMKKSRYEIFIDQCKHYASTYGTGYEGNVYCPNGEPINISYNNYTVIKAVSAQEFADMIIKTTYTDVALKSDLVEEMVAYIAKMVVWYKYNFDMSVIKNKEFLVGICDRMNIMPATGEDIVRYLYYKRFGTTLMVMSKHAIRILDFVDLPKLELTKNQEIELAKVFNRFKPFLLKYKSNPANRPIINKIRRLSKKYHEPFQGSFWSNFTNIPMDVVEKLAEKEVAKLDNNFKIIKLIQMFDLRRIQNQNRSKRIFKIRNGKVWTDENKFAPFDGRWVKIRNMLYQRLIDNLKVKFIRNHKNPWVRLPKDINLTCPTSEKSFMGNVPVGSWISTKTKDNFFGVYWRNEWGVRDYDLSFIVDDRKKVGWNATYNIEGILFSGDMTNADPEAVEMFAIKDNIPNGNIILNTYNGEVGSTYRLFIGQQKIDELPWNYMVDPNNIIYSQDGTTASQQECLARVENGNIYMVCGGMSNHVVSGTSDILFQDHIHSFLPLQEVLDCLRVTYQTKERDLIGQVPDYDFSKKSDIIDFFS